MNRPRDGSKQDTNSKDVATTSGMILPGGKVDARAIVEAAQRARELGLEPGEDEELRRVRFELRHDLDKRLDKYLTDRIAFLSRTQLQKLIDGGGVLVNGVLPKASTKLHAGDIVEVVVPAPPSKDIIPENIPLDVMYEDEYLIVVNKQPGIIVHPARSHLTGTMLSALAYHFKHVSRVGTLSAVGKELARPGVVHRLDRETSGCIVFAKDDATHWQLGHQFEHRKVEKRYVALVEGIVEPAGGVIDLPLGPHPSREKGYREKQVVRHDELGKPSVTIYRVLEHYRGGSGYSLVEVELKTGRTHQIRVHFTHMGHALVGDDMYGGKPLALGSSAGRADISRQALHAALLAFTHPATGQRLTFTAPLRGDMIAAVRALRASHDTEHLRPEGTLVDFDQLVGAG